MSYAFVPPPAPCTSFRAITPSDTVPLTGLQWLYVSVAGTVIVQGLSDATPVSLGTVAAGSFIPFLSGYVMAASTATVVGMD